MGQDLLCTLIAGEAVAGEAGLTCWWAPSVPGLVSVGFTGWPGPALSVAGPSLPLLWTTFGFNRNTVALLGCSFDLNAPVSLGERFCLDALVSLGGFGLTFA